MVTGPATDNQVGIEIIREQMNVEAFNAISNPADLGDHIIARAGLAQCARIQGSRRMSARTPAIVLGGTGYVAGELLRLIAGHPQLEVAAILSDSQPGAPVAGAFAHLRSAYPDLKFADLEEIEIADSRRTPRSALFSAAPHGVAAAHHRPAADGGRGGRRARALRRYLGRLSLCERRPPTRRCTSMRTARRREFASSPAPSRSIWQKSPTPHVAHPGCFATATLLASVPLLALGTRPIRGCSSPASPAAPARAANRSRARIIRIGTAICTPTARLSHRHVPEIIACAKLATGIEAEFNFVPHSGPFARGIHVTVQASLEEVDRHRAGAGGAQHVLPGLPLRARRRRRAAGQGCGDQQLREFERGHQRQFHCRHVGARQSRTRAPPAAPSSG